MPADSTTPLLGLLVQGTGNNNNSWGDNFNSDVLTPLETAIADIVTIAVTGGTVTLTATQARYQGIRLTGNLSSDLVIVVPDTNKVYRIINSTVGGGFFTRLKCLTIATEVNIPAGSKITTVFAKGGTPYRADSVEVGRYVYDAASATGDVIECNGASFLRTALPELFAKISTTYGAVDGTHFSVPDSYTSGKFLRSRTAAVAVGTAQTSQNKSHTHTGSGTTSGQSVTHTHLVSGTSGTESAGHTHTGSGTTSGVSVGHTHTGSGTTSGQSADHTHQYDKVSVNGLAAGAFGFVSTTSTTSGGTSNDHTHTYSFTTSGQSADHTHTYSFTTSGTSASHTHSISITSGNASVDHTHTYSFTTSTGSADGTEARPENISAVLCIRY